MEKSHEFLAADYFSIIGVDIIVNYLLLNFEKIKKVETLQIFCIQCINSETDK